MPNGKPAMSPAEKAKKYPKSHKMAIAAFCYHDCVGEEDRNSHKTKLFIKECKNTACNLYPFRPWQDITGGNTGSVREARDKSTKEEAKNKP